jgi:hypothetical protein
MNYNNTSVKTTYLKNTYINNATYNLDINKNVSSDKFYPVMFANLDRSIANGLRRITMNEIPCIYMKPDWNNDKSSIFIDEFNADSNIINDVSNIKSNIGTNKEALMELYLKQIRINNELGDKYDYNKLTFYICDQNDINKPFVNKSSSIEVTYHTHDIVVIYNNKPLSLEDKRVLLPFNAPLFTVESNKEIYVKMKCGNGTARKENINCQVGEILYKNGTNNDISDNPVDPLNIVDQFKDQREFIKGEYNEPQYIILTYISYGILKASSMYRESLVVLLNKLHNTKNKLLVVDSIEHKINELNEKFSINIDIKNVHNETDLVNEIIVNKYGEVIINKIGDRDIKFRRCLYRYNKQNVELGNDDMIDIHKYKWNSNDELILRINDFENASNNYFIKTLDELKVKKTKSINYHDNKFTIKNEDDTLGNILYRSLLNNYKIDQNKLVKHIYGYDIPYYLIDEMIFNVNSNGNENNENNENNGKELIYKLPNQMMLINNLSDIIDMLSSILVQYNIDNNLIENINNIVFKEYKNAEVINDTDTVYLYEKKSYNDLLHINTLIPDHTTFAKYQTNMSDKLYIKSIRDMISLREKEVSHTKTVIKYFDFSNNDANADVNANAEYKNKCNMYNFMVICNDMISKMDNDETCILIIFGISDFDFIYNNMYENLMQHYPTIYTIIVEPKIINSIGSVLLDDDDVTNKSIKLLNETKIMHLHGENNEFTGDILGDILSEIRMNNDGTSIDFDILIGYSNIQNKDICMNMGDCSLPSYINHHEWQVRNCENTLSYIFEKIKPSKSMFWIKYRHLITDFQSNEFRNTIHSMPINVYYNKSQMQYTYDHKSSLYNVELPVKYDIIPVWKYNATIVNHLLTDRNNIYKIAQLDDNTKDVSYNEVIYKQLHDQYNSNLVLDSIEYVADYNYINQYIVELT